jgi:hypothetical protein
MGIAIGIFRRLFPIAQFLVHPPVNGLHSIARQADTVAQFLLTLKTEGVKQTRSLTASEVFPVGAASGAQAKSPSASRDDGRKVSKGL